MRAISGIFNTSGTPQERVHRILNIAENFGSYLCRMIQVALVAIIFILFFVFSAFYLNHIFAKSRRMTSKQLCIYFGLGIFVLYNLVYNYVMAHRIGPGSPEWITDKIMKKNNITKRCKKCNGLKPIRTHHCSICDSCNIQMDHHCPWMGTCVGHHNRAFFIKFLTYLTLGCLLVVQMCDNLGYHHDESYMFLITIFYVIGGFTLFHWGIMFIGRTTLELCAILDGYKPKTWDFMHNFEIVFGTKNPIKAMLPIYIPLKFQGYEWNHKEEQDTQLTQQITGQQIDQQIDSTAS